MSMDRRLRRVVSGVVVASLVLATGCTGNDEVQKAIAGFQQASATLAATYGTFVANANTVEEENYVNKLVASPAAFDLGKMQDTDLMTPEEVAVRGAALKALGAYLAALATLAAGGSSAQIEADAATAGTSLATLDTDVNAAVAKHTGRALVDISGPVSAAVSAIGSVLKLILAHKGRAEVKKSILDNDAAVQALFALIAKESNLLYARQTAAAGGQNVAVVGAFDAEVQRALAGPGAATTPGLVDLGERLKAIPRSQVLVMQANPSEAINTFQMTHDALIQVIKEDGHNKVSLRTLLADVQSFAAEVGPLATNVQALVASF